MVTTHIELTLRELLQIALGNPKISSTHLFLLQSFFDILLNKLDSRTENIEIVGKMSTCMQKILRESRISPYPFDCAKVQTFSGNLAKVERLKERVGALEVKLIAHFKEIRDEEDLQKRHYSTSNFEKFEQSCESFCACEEAEGALACKLITNPHFIVHLIESAISPILNEMEDRRRRLRDLHGKLLDLKERMNKELAELNENFKCCIITEKFRGDFEIHKVTLEQTKSEINNMLLAKLDRTELTFIKRKFRKQLRSIDAEWNKLETLLKREMEVKKNIGPKQCISCLGPLYCARDPAKPKPVNKCAEEKNSEIRKETKRSKIKTCAKVLLDGLQRSPKTVEIYK